ncbi:hypothetical protein [Pedobacter sp. P26]|uniref:hypothetical protein n=1 Tax=Pedobacter sp. P26 TaxID=3423956 RepID=UPI003D67E62A
MSPSSLCRVLNSRWTLNVKTIGLATDNVDTVCYLISKSDSPYQDNPNLGYSITECRQRLRPEINR